MTEMQTLFDQQKLILERTINKLLQTYQKLNQPDQALSEDDQEELLEVLTSRFARLADLYTQKLLNFFFRVLQEPDLSFIDKCQRLEKLGVIEDGKLLYSIRVLQNQIAHDYAADHLDEIYQTTLLNTPVLIKMIEDSLHAIEENQKKLRSKTNEIDGRLLKSRPK